MRIVPHANLTITLIRRAQFGSLRLRGSGTVYLPPPRSLAYRLRAERLWAAYICQSPRQCPDTREDLARPVSRSCDTRGRLIDVLA